jgi:23S rRNA (adenine2030-N6)-methyltransferase
MNYRHAYHAGNHADVLKHIALTRVIAHLKRKPKPFRIIDAHAGIGAYDLHGIEAGKTGEWDGGIGKLVKPLAPEVEALIAPYREVIAELNPAGGFTYYPGSPELVARLTRPEDRLLLNELHPDDHARLLARYRGNSRIKVTQIDAMACVKSSLPPPERRGLVLIDPPYESKDEAQRSITMLQEGLRRFASGIFMLWYPLKADETARTVRESAQALGCKATLQVELRIREAFSGGGLAGSGLVIANTPWQLDTELDVITSALAQRLGLGDWGQATVRWLVPPA